MCRGRENRRMECGMVGWSGRAGCWLVAWLPLCQLRATERRPLSFPRMHALRPVHARVVFGKCVV